MAAITLKNNESYTSSGTEDIITPDPTAYIEVPFMILKIELVSGDVQFSVGEAIVSGHRHYTVAGDKALFTVDHGTKKLRCKGVGVFTISW